MSTLPARLTGSALASAGGKALAPSRIDRQTVRALAQLELAQVAPAATDALARIAAASTVGLTNIVLDASD